MIISGIDFSINSSGICILNTNNMHYTFYNVYRKLTKRQTKMLNTLNIELIHNINIKAGNDEITKIKDAIITTDLIFNIIKNTNFISIEGFAFGARSNRLAEISGYQYLLRERLINNNIPFKIYAPTTIKKFAGNGRFKKLDMINEFLKTDLLLAKQINNVKTKTLKPIDDIVDSYFICNKLKNDLLKEQLIS